MTLRAAKLTRLYQIDRSATTIWRYSSADRNIDWSGHTWSKLAISDDGIRLTGEASADEIKIVLPANTPAAQLFRVHPPSSEVFVTVYDYDADTETGRVCWVGSISSVNFSQQGSAELVCDSLSASMRRDGLSLRYERSCPHSIYDNQCTVQKSLHALPCRITAMTGVTVTVQRDDWRVASVLMTDDTRLQLDVDTALIFAAGRLRWGGVEHAISEVEEDGWVTPQGGIGGLLAGASVEIIPPLASLGSYSYGAAEWPLEGATEMRGIELATGTTAELIGGTYGLSVGAAITLYPGCDGLRSTCAERFNNLLNHGGFPHMPGESIFGKRLW